MACALVPLDEQQVTEPGPLGREVTLPALVSLSLPGELSFNPVYIQKVMFLLCLRGQHPHRKAERCFVPYKAPPEDGSAAELEEFLEHAKFITEDLEWLLSLPHDKFWCQVSTCQCVNSIVGCTNAPSV